MTYVTLTLTYWGCLDYLRGCLGLHPGMDNLTFRGDVKPYILGGSLGAVCAC